MIRLTDEERQRFAIWCEEHAEQGKLILPQMEKLKVAPMVELTKRKIFAMAMVAAELRSIEVVTIRKEPPHA